MSELRAVAVGAAGAVIGLGIGGPAGARLGFSFGMLAGNLLFPPTAPTQGTGKLSDVRVSEATQGTPLPIVYGRGRVAGVIVCAQDKKSHKKKQKSSGKGGGPQAAPSYYYSDTFLILWCDNPVTSYRRLFTPEKVVYDNREGQDRWAKGFDPDNIEALFGSAFQSPSWIIEEVLGVGNVPGYRGFGGHAFKNLNLEPFGNNVPNLSAEIDTGYWSVGDVLRDLATRARIPSEKCDFSALDGVQCIGFVIPQQIPLKNAFDALGKSYLFDVVEYDGLLKAVKRGGTPTFSLTWEELGAGLAGNQRITLTRAQEVELPRRVIVRYPSEALDFQGWGWAAQRSTRYSQTETSIDVPCTLTDTQGMRLAYSTLYSLWEGRLTAETSVFRRHLLIAPADVGTVETPTDVYTVRADGVTVGLIGAVGLSLTGEEPSVYTQTINGVSPADGGAGVGGLGAADFAVFDINALSDPDADTFLLYGAVASDDPAWDGGDLRFSPKLVRASGNPNVTPFDHWDVSSTFGRSTTALPAAPTIHTTDETTVVTVVLTDGSLESVTQEEVYVGANLCVLGAEIMQFRTATLVGANTWELTGLSRGRRGTEQAARAGHDAGEPFAMADEDGKRADYKYSEVGKSFAVRLYEDGIKYEVPPDAATLTPVGNSRRPYSPVQLAAVRDGGTQTVALSWVRRVRRADALVNGTDAPLDEPTEEYEIEFYHPTNNGLLRTVHVAGAPSYAYTSAMQTADLGAPGAFKWRVWQYTTYRSLGRGRGSETMSVS